MAFEIKRVEYYNTTVEDHAGEGSKLLSLFAGVGVNLLAFKAVPLEPMRTQFTLFPNDGLKMTNGRGAQVGTGKGPKRCFDLLSCVCVHHESGLTCFADVLPN